MKKRVETYLYTHIPLSKALGIRVEEASTEKVILFAPLAENINHKQTAFGGSLHAVATLACWSLLYINLTTLEPLQIVITKSEVDYRAPIDADFRAECLKPEPAVWDRFFKMLSLKGKGRISLAATIHQQNRLSVAYQGTFAALK